jgi:hypothetical protein
MHQRLILVHTINHQRFPTPHITNRLIRQFLHAHRLHNNIKPVRIIFLPIEVLGSDLPVELDVFICCVQLLRDIHFDALLRGERYFAGAV